MIIKVIDESGHRYVEINNLKSENQFLTDKREVSIKVQFEAGKLQIRASKEGSLTVEVANLRDRLDLLEGGKKTRKRASGSQKAKKRKLKNRENAKRKI